MKITGQLIPQLRAYNTESPTSREFILGHNKQVIIARPESPCRNIWLH